MGLFDSLRPEKWAALARTLGFSPYRPHRGYDEAMCFRRMERVRGLVATHETPSFQHWLWGVHHGTATVLIQYETGGGSSQTAWTAAIARIDPPLNLGLEVSSENFFNRLFGGRDIAVGDAAADRQLRIHSLDAERTAALLSPADDAGRDLLGHMTSIVGGYTAYVGDSFVRVARSGVHPDPPEALALLDAAVALAARLCARNASMPPPLALQAQRDAWWQFAENGRFTFDAPRMVVRGTRDGVTFEIAQEIEERRISTSVDARFPWPAQLPFSAQRTATPSFLQGVFSQDIRVGDSAFDAAFKVQGSPEAEIQQLLRRPRLLQAMLHGASLSTDLEVASEGLSARMVGPVLHAAHLEMLLSWACTVSEEIVGRTAPTAPYR